MRRIDARSSFGCNAPQSYPVMILLLIILLVLPGMAEAFNDFDPLRETLIFGQSPYKERTKNSEVINIGEWIQGPDGLSLKLGAAQPKYFRFPGMEPGFMGDGMIRARLRMTRAGNFSLFFRIQGQPYRSGQAKAAGNESYRDITGYELRIEKGSACFYRLAGLSEFQLNPPAKIPFPKETMAIEVIVFAIGPYLAAIIYDEDSLGQLASFTSTDKSHGSGNTGAGVLRNEGAPASFTSLSIMQSRFSNAVLPQAAAPLNGNPGHEIILFDSQKFQNESDILRSHIVYGNWAAKQNGLHYPGFAGKKNNYWFPDYPGSIVHDGVLRARIDTGSKIDLSLMFRATIHSPGNSEILSGYGFSIAKDKIGFHRWDSGMARPMQTLKMKKVKGLKKEMSIDLMLFLLGPQVAAFLYEAGTHKLLATLAVSDAAHLSGRAGLRAYHTQSQNSYLSLLSLLPARGFGPMENKMESRTQIPRLREGELFGAERLLTVTSEKYKKIPKRLKSKVKVVRTDITKQGNKIFYLLTNPLGLELLRRASINPSSLSSDTPWKHLDSNYRDCKRKTPSWDRETGVKIDCGYKDPEMVESLLKAFHAHYPDITQYHEIGRTHQGRPICALKISDHPHMEENEPAILLNGMIHGHEPLSAEFVFDAIKYLVEGYQGDQLVRNWVDSFEIWCVPQLNPDGAFMFFNISSANYFGRKNGRDNNANGRQDIFDGVDLNRNFPFRWRSMDEKASSSVPSQRFYRGPKPGSEPETRALIALADQERFIFSLSYHTSSTVVLSPYTIEGARNPEPDTAWKIAQEIIPLLPKQPNGKNYRIRRNIYPVEGTDQDWLYHHHGTLAYIVEGPYHNTAYPGKKNKFTITSARLIWRKLMDRYLLGPSVYGHVLDTKGRVIPNAEVRIKEMILHEGEKWKTRAKDGRFDFYLPGPGAYTIEVSKPRYQTERIPIIALAKGRKEIKVLLREKL